MTLESTIQQAIASAIQVADECQEWAKKLCWRHYVDNGPIPEYAFQFRVISDYGDWQPTEDTPYEVDVEMEIEWQWLNDNTIPKPEWQTVASEDICMEIGEHGAATRQVARIKKEPKL